MNAAITLCAYPLNMTFLNKRNTEQTIRDSKSNVVERNQIFIT